MGSSSCRPETALIEGFQFSERNGTEPGIGRSFGMKTWSARYDADP
ncbi:MAG: hypothetical protein AB7J35_18375 [Dehalococcoidia bacterium]